MKRTEEAKLFHFLGVVPARLHIRNDLHIARKVWHMVTGLIIVLCYMAGIQQPAAIVILGAVLCLDLIVESSRLRSSIFNDKILKFMGPIMRTHEIKQMSTVPHYLCSAILAIAIFPKPVAILSILFLAFGDPLASFFGILYGSKGPRFSNGKTLIGTLAGVVTCSLLTFMYLCSSAPSDGTLLVLTLVGGLAGGMAELLPFDIDDNFTIPMISGFALWFAFMATGI